ncbi:MAG: hypothetical protein JW940_02515 [Polyangiaceae bacterium]|nr:hypothetical protein [Polyangiaceae bacterium]
MRFGHFDDDAREYVITTPKTPYPWINYLGTQEFFGLISQQAGGYCFYRDARLRRLTRYRYHNVPLDAGGRYFYIREENRMVNIWNPYQCMVTFNMSRSASYFETGIGQGMGFRDSNQDMLGFVHLVPERARQRIIDIAFTQFPDGSAYHQYQPLTKRGNHDVGSGFNDDPLWLIAGTAAYIKETGDWSILQEQVPFNNDVNNQATLLEHCKRSFYHVLNNRGPHGLPLIGRADWNDCLNLNCFSETPDDPYQTTANREGRTAESVFIAGMFVMYGPEYAAMAEKMGQPDEARLARERVAEMEQTVLQHGWDGQWFLRAYDYFGNKVGSNECEDGKILIEPQGFCVMARIGVKSGQAKQALDSVRERLETPYGIVLNNPAHSEYHVELVAETAIGRRHGAAGADTKRVPAQVGHKSVRCALAGEALASAEVPTLSVGSTLATTQVLSGTRDPVHPDEDRRADDTPGKLDGHSAKGRRVAYRSPLIIPSREQRRRSRRRTGRMELTPRRGKGVRSALRHPRNQRQPCAISRTGSAHCLVATVTPPVSQHALQSWSQVDVWLPAGLAALFTFVAYVCAVQLSGRRTRSVWSPRARFAGRCIAAIAMCGCVLGVYVLWQSDPDARERVYAGVVTMLAVCSYVFSARSKRPPLRDFLNGLFSRICMGPPGRAPAAATRRVPGEMSKSRGSVAPRRRGARPILASMPRRHGYGRLGPAAPRRRRGEPRT